MKNELAKEKTLTGSLAQHAEINVERNTLIHEECGRILGVGEHQKNEDFTNLNDFGANNEIQDTIDNFQKQVQTEMDLLREKYRAKWVMSYQKNLKQVESGVAAKKDLIYKERVEIEPMSHKKQSLTEEVVRVKSEYDEIRVSFENSYEKNYQIEKFELLKKSKKLDDELDQMMVKIREGKLSNDRYDRLVLDMQEEISLYQSLMDSVGGRGLSRHSSQNKNRNKSSQKKNNKSSETEIHGWPINEDFSDDGFELDGTVRPVRVSQSSFSAVADKSWYNDLLTKSAY